LFIFWSNKENPIGLVLPPPTLPYECTSQLVRCVDIGVHAGRKILRVCS
jgi:hypothetical protein